jgi:RNA polymerase sigma-70 factor (ECF subfamily)
MKKTCKTFGSDGKGNGRAGSGDVVGRMLSEFIDGRNLEAYNFAYGLCRDSEEARELVQEACYRVLRERERFDLGKPVKSLLFTVLRNAFTDSRRRAERRRGLSLDYGTEEGSNCLHEILAGDDEAVLTRLEREESAALVRQAMSRLGRKDRKYLTLCDGEGVPYESVARTMGVPIGTVRSRVFRARRKLRSAALRCGLRATD